MTHEVINTFKRKLGRSLDKMVSLLKATLLKNSTK